MKAALLPDRGVVKVAGSDARRFLNGLVTANVEQVTPEQAAYAALLTPQGKIIADFIIVEAPEADGGGFFLDCPRALAGQITTRLGFYKLRAAVTVENLSESLGALAVWDGAGSTEYGLLYADPRLSALGQRVILPPHVAGETTADLGAELVDADAYEAHRLALGIPRGGLDFIYGDAFPHEADMDQLRGVDFAKGCYVGQEVVSRMEHRGTARKRVVPVRFEVAPEPGVTVLAGDAAIGMMGSSAQGHGVALLRLDRAAEAAIKGVPLLAGGVAITIEKPAWARFSWPPVEKASA